MTIIKEINQKVHGIDKRKFGNSIVTLTDQLRLIEQKITMSTDNNIDNNYQVQQEDINHTHATIQKITKKQRRNTEKIFSSNFVFKAKKRLS